MHNGVLTVDLPTGIVKGQFFKVIARQITNAAARRPTPPPPPPAIAAPHGSLEPAAVRDLIEWRRVLGTFQLGIPVETKNVLLGPEERLLSVLRWIAEAIPPDNRWYPVFRRYLGIIGDRVGALGGDPTHIDPSPTGEGGRKPPVPEDLLCSTGKIAGLIFDRYGDFSGFLLDTEDGEREFLSREKEIEELAERAWRGRLRITVCAERHSPKHPETIIVRKPPAPFWH